VLSPTSFASYGGKVYFAGTDPEAGRELWSTDGTAAGTRRAEDLWPGAVGSSPDWLTASGGVLWFAADSPVYGRELWKYTPDEPTVLARQVFYNNSAFDAERGNALYIGDDHAIAPDKRPLLPGEAPTFANVTSYSKGINGIVIDISALPAGATLTPQDFTATTPPTGVTVRRGAGVGGSDRVTLTWRNYNPLDISPAAQAIANGWLTVTLKANTHTGLLRPDVFSFGNLIGDADGDRRVNALDLGQVKRLLNTTAGLDSRVDFNRDGKVNALDLGIVKRYLNQTLAAPVLSETSVAATAPLAAAPGRSLLDDEGQSPSLTM